MSVRNGIFPSHVKGLSFLRSILDPAFINHMFSFAKSLRVAEIYRSPMLDHPLKHLICFFVDFLFVPSFSSNTYAVDGLLLMFHFHSELSSAKTVYIVTDVLKVSCRILAGYSCMHDGRCKQRRWSRHVPKSELSHSSRFRLRTDGCVREAVGTCKSLHMSNTPQN